jgi:hypothetical protein
VSALSLELWTRLAELDVSGSRFALLYKHLVLNQDEAWELAHLLPEAEKRSLTEYVSSQIQSVPALATAAFGGEKTGWLIAAAYSTSETQVRLEHILSRLQRR